MSDLNPCRSFKTRRQDTTGTAPVEPLVSASFARPYVVFSATSLFDSRAVVSDDLLKELRAALGSTYLIDRELGGGGMARVFVATDVRLERGVVVKVLSPELVAGISAERFTREIKLAAQLQEPHIVPVLADGVTSGGLPYYTMPFVRGASLRHRMNEGAVPLAEAKGILRDIAKALVYAHGRGVVHRDIKPENVLLHEGTAVVTDFGIAKAISASRTEAPGATLTQVGTSLGTPAYMAPEQAAGDEVDTGADVYSWGIVAHELLSGRHPFADRATAQQLMAAHIAESPAPLSKTSPATPTALSELVMRTLAKKPADRPSAAALLSELDAMSTGEAPAGQRRSSLANRYVLGTAAVILAIALTIAVRRGYFARGPNTSGDSPGIQRSVVVMPLSNVGGDTADAYFTDGLTEELTNAVAKIPGIRVVGGSSAAAWKGQSDPGVKAIAERLHVTDVLEGTVRRAGPKVRVYAKLTSARDEQIVWSASYEKPLEDVFALQADIARKVAAGLRINLAVVDSTRLERGGTRDTLAHELFLRARVVHLQYGEQNIRQAIALYRKATARDPMYADAWASEAFAWYNLTDEYMSPREAAPHLNAAARKALSIDSTRGDAQLALAISLEGREPMRDVAARAAVAAAAAPNDALVQLLAGIKLAAVDAAAGADLEARGRTLDPLSAVAALGHAFVLRLSGQLADAERAGRDAVALQPELGLAHATLGLVLLDQNRNADALSAFKQGIDGGDRDMSYMGAGIALARLGRTAEAQRHRQMLESDSRKRYVIGDWVAKLCLALGDRDGALTWLERAANERSSYITLIDVDTTFAPLRGDPRFEAVRRKVGLK